MSTIDQVVDVQVPVHTAYDQWTQFNEFPRFMEGVDRIEQVSDTRTHWVTRIAGVRREFDVEITDQRPDERIAWCSLGVPRQAGDVTFSSLGPDATRVTLHMDYAPEGLAEKTGDRLHLVQRRVRDDMRRFKRFIETRGGPGPTPAA
jgi:uncharacterized membrane protein